MKSETKDTRNHMEAYLELAGTCELPLFMQPHWLDAVCQDGEWGVALSFDKIGKVDAAMPYFQKSKFGVPYLTMPLLTPCLGIWFRPEEDLSHRRLMSRQEHQVSAILDSLPQAQWHRQRLHHSLASWLPFYWAGYSEQTKYSFQIADCTDEEVVYGAFSSGIKQQIRKAEQVYTVERPEHPGEAFPLILQSLDRSGLVKSTYARVLDKIEAELQKRNQRHIYLARDRENRVAAAVYIVYDNATSYNLLNGRDPSVDVDGATALLIWHAIRDAGKRQHVFDFEGSMLPGVHAFFRSFGGDLIAQSLVSKYLGWARIMKLSE